MAINQDPHIHQMVMCANIFVRRDGRYLLLRRSEQKKFLPSIVHPIGGKLDTDENPYLGVQRELMEEAGLQAKNLRLKAVLLEIKPHPGHMPHNWMIFYFTGDYASGELNSTDEGKHVWLTPDEIIKQKLFPSLREIITYILNPDDGPVFATFAWDQHGAIVQKTKRIDACAR
ncbi:MAG: NUDIX domain-containing protein [Patescibacteria group bacterium]|nr:NUDIX domain-containing protein [Patescibacteria group bacterium]